MSHVPEENLVRYRRLKAGAEAFDSLANRLSGLGFYEDANMAWRWAAVYREQMGELRT